MEDGCHLARGSVVCSLSTRSSCVTGCTDITRHVLPPSPPIVSYNSVCFCKSNPRSTPSSPTPLEWSPTDRSLEGFTSGTSRSRSFKLWKHHRPSTPAAVPNHQAIPVYFWASLFPSAYQPLWRFCERDVLSTILGWCKLVHAGRSGIPSWWRWDKCRISVIACSSSQWTSKSWSRLVMLPARLPFLEKGILDILSNATGGLSIVLEHRWVPYTPPWSCSAELIEWRR